MVADGEETRVRGHGEHEVEPEVAEKVPAAHAVHGRPDKEEDPGGQGRQWVWLVLEVVPSRQSVQ